MKALKEVDTLTRFAGSVGHFTGSMDEEMGWDGMGVVLWRC